MIKLKIERTVENPRYEKQMEEYVKTGCGFAKAMDTPQRYLTENVLNVEITAEQFEAIRKEVLKMF